MNSVRFGILGAGRGADLAQAIHHAPTSELIAICDQDMERLINVTDKFPTLKTYNSWAAMLDSDIDAVIVASPMPLHVQHSIDALKAGKHVLSEVTAATSIEQCWQLLEAVLSSNRKYMLASNYCYMWSWSIVMGLVKLVSLVSFTMVKLTKSKTSKQDFLILNKDTIGEQKSSHFGVVIITLPMTWDHYTKPSASVLHKWFA